MSTLEKILFLVIIVPVFMQNSGISGAWEINGDVAGNSVDGICTLQQAGNKITGKCELGNLGQPFDVRAEVKNKQITWKFNSEYSGQALSTTFTGTIDSAGSKLTDTVEVQPIAMSGDFIAKKEAPKKSQ